MTTKNVPSWVTGPASLRHWAILEQRGYGDTPPGISWDEKSKGWMWNGDVPGLVRAVGDGDARLGFVTDLRTGASITMNISGTDEPAAEPFYIQDPRGDNMYDAYNRKEAIMILSNIRKGAMYPDMPQSKYRASGKSGGKKKKTARASAGRARK